MAYQKVFKRYELKYMLTGEQKDRVVKALQPYMSMDKYGRTTIRNIYFDTPDYILARHSIAKPDFKEKLRVRTYSQVVSDENVFVELKRKFDHVVYKRRVSIPRKQRWNGPRERRRTATPTAIPTSFAARSITFSITIKICSLSCFSAMNERHTK